MVTETEPIVKALSQDDYLFEIYSTFIRKTFHLIPVESIRTRAWSEIYVLKSWLEYLVFKLDPFI